jgi:hypothetical protein
MFFLPARLRGGQVASSRIYKFEGHSTRVADHHDQVWRIIIIVVRRGKIGENDDAEGGLSTATTTRWRVARGVWTGVGLRGVDPLVVRRLE